MEIHEFPCGNRSSFQKRVDGDAVMKRERIRKTAHSQQCLLLMVLMELLQAVMCFWIWRVAVVGFEDSKKRCRKSGIRINHFPAADYAETSDLRIYRTDMLTFIDRLNRENGSVKGTDSKASFSSVICVFSCAYAWTLIRGFRILSIRAFNTFFLIHHTGIGQSEEELRWSNSRINIHREEGDTQKTAAAASFNNACICMIWQL